MLCRKKLRDSHKKTILIFYIPKFQYSVNLLINILFTNHILVSTCCCNKLPQKWWLKQHEFMIFTFWRWENKNKPPWAKIKMSARPPSFEEAPGENVFSCLCQLAEVAAHTPAGPLPSSNPAVSGWVPLVLPSLWSSFFYLEGLLWLHWTHLDGPGCSPHLKGNWWAKNSIATLILLCLGI